MFKLYKYNDDSEEYEFVMEDSMYGILSTMRASSGEIFKIVSPQGQEAYYNSNGVGEEPTKR